MDYKEELKHSIPEKIRMLRRDFKIPLTLGEMSALRKCTTPSSLELEVRHILKKRLPS